MRSVESSECIGTGDAVRRRKRVSGLLVPSRQIAKGDRSAGGQYNTRLHEVEQEDYIYLCHFFCCWRRTLM